MRNRAIVRLVAVFGVALALGIAGCGGDDEGEDDGGSGETTTEPADLTPELAAENLEAAGYEGVEIDEDPIIDCPGLESEVDAYTDPEGKTVQGSVHFFASEDEALAGEECVIKGVTQYCSQAAIVLVYSADCYRLDEGEQTGRITDLQVASQGES